MRFNAISQKQAEIFRFPHENYDALICDGAVRTGKTIMMIVSFLEWAMNEFSGVNFAICGKTVRAAERNIVMPLLSLRSVTRKYNISYTRSMSLMTVKHRGRVNYFYVFGGKDESSYMLIQGITLAGVLFDEVALMPQSFVEQAIARTLSVSAAKLWFNCNPDSPMHWFYREWVLQPEKHRTKHIHFLMEDNPGLTPEAIERAKASFAGVFYDRYIRGLWVVAEGRVYPMFTDDPDRFILHGTTAGMDGQFYVSIDYGTVNPTAMQLWCVRGKEAILIRESYFDSRREGYQKTDEEHYEALEELTRGYYIRRVVVDPSAASFIECIRRHGKFYVWEAENSVINGIRVTGTLLNSGMIKIHESCKDTIREFGLYRWDEKKNEDAVIKENDHAMDAMRYFCSTVLSREFRWIPWR